MTRANKIVILTVDRRFRDRAYILNESEGTWDGGIWYSNDAYLPYPPPHPLGIGDSRWGWAYGDTAEWPPDQCQVCRAIVDLTDEQCPYCGGCPFCGDWPEHCACYTPAAVGHRRPAAHRA